jgi:predicted HTH transcriptional regulator
MYFHNRHLSDITDILRTFIGHNLIKDHQRGIKGSKNEAQMMEKAILYVKRQDMCLHAVKTPKTPLRRNKGAIKNINDGKIKTVMYVKERGKITNTEYQKLTGVSRQMTTIDLTGLVEKKIFIRIGKAGKGIAYQLTKLTNE